MSDQPSPVTHVSVDTLTTGALIPMPAPQLTPSAGNSLAQPGAAPLDLAIAAWLDAKAHKSESAKTWRAYHDTLSAFRAMLQGAGLDLDSDPRAIGLAAQGWAGQSRDSAPVAPATYNQRLAILSSFYQFARKRDLLPLDNPIAMVERRTVEQYANAEPIPLADLQRQLKAIDRTTPAGQRDYALLAIYLQTGRRLSEVANLRWGDVHLNGDRATLHFRRAKGGKVMADTLPASVGKLLLTWLQTHYGAQLGSLPNEAPIWVSFSGNSRGKALSIRSIAQICEDRLGVSKVHALRHTFARVMEDEGAKVSDIQARLGHTSLATTGRYLAALKRAENTHADKLARRFGFDDA